MIKFSLLKTPFRLFGEKFSFKMSALSPTMDNGTIAEWLVKVGDEVEEEQGLAVIETDKAKVTLQSADAGYVAKLMFEEGAREIPVGEVIGYLVEEKEDIDTFTIDTPVEKVEDTKIMTKEEVKTKPVIEDTKVEEHEISTITDKLFISPKARKLADLKNINLQTDQINGTGPNGRIISENIEDYIKSDKEQTQKNTKSNLTVGKDWQEIPISSTRKIIAKRLSESKRDIPHFYLEASIEMDKLLDFKKLIKNESDIKLSINDFIIKSVAHASMIVPEVRSQWIDGTVRLYNNVDVCFAVDSPTGLITPKILEAQNKSLSIINSEVKDKIKRAREGGLLPEEFMGGTFTISNLGNFGIDSFSAVINPPQSCILAVGSTLKVPTEGEDGSVKWINKMSVTLSCDHRVVDGAVGARWLAEFKKAMQNPLLMMI